jgi:hypothetical protein
MAVRHKEMTGSVKLQKLIAQLREAADTLEADEPMLDASKMSAINAELEVLMTKLSYSEREALLVSKTDYLKARSQWLDAWNLNTARMEVSVAHILEVSDLTAEIDTNTISGRLHLLTLMLSRKGLASVLELCKLQPLPALAPQDYGIAIDHQANQALLLWGQMEQDEFLQKVTTFDQQTIKRSAKAVGMPSARWNKNSRRELHRRAVRFARNTTI